MIVFLKIRVESPPMLPEENRNPEFINATQKVAALVQGEVNNQVMPLSSPEQRDQLWQQAQRK